MGVTGSFIVYIIIWWIVFFSLLPIGIQSNKRNFKENLGGTDPGAPKNLILEKNFYTQLLLRR